MRTPALCLLPLTLALACTADDGVLDAGPVPDAAAPADAGEADAGEADAGEGACPTPGLEDPTVYATELGSARGALEDGVLSFRAIPFAEPPVGALRWRPPVRPSACFGEVFDATTWGPACPQIPQQVGQPFDPDAPIRGDEDCLQLNVFTAEGASPGDDRPVMVFVHGGGNTIGSAVEETGPVKLYDGSALVRAGGVVVVTVQYRLGPLGYLTHPGLDLESADGVSGNYGILDQVAALEWVQRNIASFGGDPSRVTLFGESAGAVNTCVHVASPRSAGLFHRAIVQSGSCNSNPPAADKRAEAEIFVENAECDAAEDAIACLRAQPTEALLRAGVSEISVATGGDADMKWGPNVDGVVLPESPLDAMLGGRHNHVPLIVGHNTDETARDVPQIPSEAAYRQFLTAIGGPMLANRIIALYPPAQYGTPRDALIQALTDARFGCQARLTARAAAIGQPEVPVYRYLFAQPILGSGPAVARFGAFHGAELVFVFDALRRYRDVIEAEGSTIDTMQRLWTDFAADGSLDPADWPRYESDEALLRIESPTSTVTAWRAAECDFFDALVGLDVPPP